MGWGNEWSVRDAGIDGERRRGGRGPPLIGRDFKKQTRRDSFRVGNKFGSGNFFEQSVYAIHIG